MDRRGRQGGTEGGGDGAEEVVGWTEGKARVDKRGR